MSPKRPPPEEVVELEVVGVATGVVVGIGEVLKVKSDQVQKWIIRDFSRRSGLSVSQSTTDQ
jgi:hypothetical protein